MDEAVFFDTMRQALWVATIIAMPVLAAALFTGLIIGLFQALTSIQELTLTFVPKLAAMLVVFWASMGFMAQSIVSLFHETILPLIIGA
ncbi:flagellar biosynthetic protein FliQ [Rhodobacteraceae bacterium 63075]|nr:flagellar biosynthetic protein FliQ [Rhodobacteraceae bacterium 63075]